MPYHVSKAEFNTLVEQALRELPPPFDQYIEEVTLEVRERPSRAMLKDLEMEEDELLLGLYHGRPRTERNVEDGPGLPDVIYIFQEDVELASDSRDDLIAQVRTTVLHEIGHHFGMSEEHLDDLGYG